MGFWDGLKGGFSRMSDGLKGKVTQFKNSTFADGTMAVCALIAAADGDISAAEREKTAGFISNNDVLKAFDVKDLRAKFEYFCDKLTKDFYFGKIEAIQAAAKLKSKPDQARAAVQIGVIIGGADGNFDKNERAVLKELCYAVGIDPNEFEL